MQSTKHQPLAVLMFIALLHALVVVIFTRGFLLTRVELTTNSTCTSDLCPDSKQYSKAVVLIVDAVRYDFVCENTTPNKPYAGTFPKTMQFVDDAVSTGCNCIPASNSLPLLQAARIQCCQLAESRA